MRKIAIMLFCLSITLTGCTGKDVDIVISSEQMSSTPISSEASSEESSKTVVSSEPIKNQPSSAQTSSQFQSETVTSEITENNNIESIRVSINSISPSISYGFSEDEIKEFMLIYNEMKYEDMGFDSSIKYPPGGGPESPCSLAIKYTDGQENEYWRFPVFNYNGNICKPTSGAKEVLDFISNLDCYKKEKIDLYALWLEDNEE